MTVLRENVYSAPEFLKVRETEQSTEPDFQNSVKSPVSIHTAQGNYIFSRISYAWTFAARHSVSGPSHKFSCGKI